MSWLVLAAAALAGGAPPILAPAPPPPDAATRLNQFNLITRLGLRQGQWRTTYTIDDARLEPIAAATPVDPAIIERLRAMIGTTKSTDDCITPRISNQDEIILPGLRITDIADSRWSAEAGKLSISVRVGELTGFHSLIDVSGQYAPSRMQMSVAGETINAQAKVTIRATMRSEFVGQCSLMKEP